MLTRLSSLISPSAASKLEKQREILVARRQTEDRVLLYSLVKDDATIDPRLLFSNAKGELLLASGDLLHPDSTVPIKVRVFAYQGRLSTIQFSRSPKEMIGGPISLTDFRLANDPDVSVPSQERTAGWSGVVSKWSGLTHVRPKAPPLNEEERERIVKALEVELPVEYLDAITQAEGLTVGPIKISGVTAIGVIPLLADNELITLAEGPDGLIGVTRPSGELVLYDGDEVQPLSVSFGEYIGRVIRPEKSTNDSSTH